MTSPGEASALRVLVAGATGETGQALLQELAAAGHRVRVLVRPCSAGRLAGTPVDDVHTGDVTEPASLAGCCAGIDVVISTITRTAPKQRHAQVDYAGNLALLEEARRAGVRRFVFVSSVGAGRVPGVPVLEQKGRFEAALRTSGIGWLIVRPSALFQDMDRVFAMARRPVLTLFGTGRQLVTPLAEADLARLIVERLEGPDEALDAGGPRTYTMDEVGALAQAALGRPARMRHVPVGVFAAVVAVVKVVAPDAWPVMRFVQHVFGSDNAAPELGRLRLEDHFAALAAGAPGAHARDAAGAYVRR